jgi:hypothetical protein
MSGLASVTPISFLRKLRSLAQKISLLIASLCLCLLAAELLTRWLFPQFSPGVQLRFQAMPDGFALGPPGQTERQATPKGDFNVQVKFNQYGLRDAKDLREATAADWFAVGDSFTLGWGVDEEKRFSNLLEQKLRASSNPARVYNIATPGNFIDYEHLVKYAESRGTHIRHLIVGVCMGNDLEDYRSGKSDWEEVRHLKIPTAERIRRWFRAHSALYIFISCVMENSPASRKLMERVGVAIDVNAMFDTSRHQPNETVLKTARDELLKLTAGRDAVVLIIPDRSLWFGSKPEAVAQTHETFVQMCRDAGLKVVDPKPIFNKDPNPRGFYFANDPHWSPRGHEIAAEELFKAIYTSKQK